MFLRELESNAKQEQKSDPKTSHWAFLDFPDYVEIIRTQENWRNIFKKYFIIEKHDINKKKDELISFLQRFINLRNTVVHAHRQLEKSEKDELYSADILIDKIYTKWKKASM